MSHRPSIISPQPSAISHVSGRGLPLRGNDIDTDRIMPARFLVSVSFEGLERHLFEDDRAAAPAHPFNDPRFHGASIIRASCDDDVAAIAAIYAYHVLHGLASFEEVPPSAEGDKLPV